MKKIVYMLIILFSAPSYSTEIDLNIDEVTEIYLRLTDQELDASLVKMVGPGFELQGEIAKILQGYVKTQSHTLGFGRGSHTASFASHSLGTPDVYWSRFQTKEMFLIFKGKARTISCEVGSHPVPLRFTPDGYITQSEKPTESYVCTIRPPGEDFPSVLEFH